LRSSGADVRRGVRRAVKRAVRRMERRRRRVGRRFCVVKERFLRFLKSGQYLFVMM
jgi:hypothetical protein